MKETRFHEIQVLSDRPLSKKDAFLGVYLRMMSGWRLSKVYDVRMSSDLNYDAYFCSDKASEVSFKISEGAIYTLAELSAIAAAQFFPERKVLNELKKQVGIFFLPMT